jgi:hypothetical protein
VLEALQDESKKMKMSLVDKKKRIHHKSKSCLSIIPSTQEAVETGYCHPGVFFRNMALLLDQDAILCADIGGGFFCFDALPVDNRSYLNISSQTMHYGWPVESLQ